MKLLFAYLGLLLTWGTTPLAVKWSVGEVSVLFSLGARVVCASVLCLALVCLFERRLPMSKQALQSYWAGSLGIVFAMMCVYWGSRHVSSGLVSVLFGLTPVCSGLLSVYFLDERLLLRHWLGVLVAIGGLVLVFSAKIGLDNQWLATLSVLVSVFLFAFSGVLVKKIAAPISPMQQTTGMLLIGAVGYTLLLMGEWLISDHAFWPMNVSLKVWASIVYLILLATVGGFFLYFYVLNRLGVNAVSLTTLVTPVIALAMGAWLNGEQLSLRVWLGAALIGAGLLVYQFKAVRVFVSRRVLRKPISDLFD